MSLWLMLIVVMACAGPGCPGSESGTPETTVDDKDKGKLPSRENYIEATVAIGCSDLKPDLTPDAKAQKRKTALAKWGFDKASYARAQKSYAGDLTIRPIVEQRVTIASCAGDDSPTSVVGPGWVFGTYKGTIRGGGIRGNITLNIAPDSIEGVAKGMYNNGEWSTPLDGDFRKGTFSGRGSQEGTNLRVNGRLGDDGATGSLTGQIGGRPVTMTFTASHQAGSK